MLSAATDEHKDVRIYLNCEFITRSLTVSQDLSSFLVTANSAFKILNSSTVDHNCCSWLCLEVHSRSYRLDDFDTLFSMSIICESLANPFNVGLALMIDISLATTTVVRLVSQGSFSKSSITSKTRIMQGRLSFRNHSGDPSKGSEYLYAFEVFTDGVAQRSPPMMCETFSG